MSGFNVIVENQPGVCGNIARVAMDKAKLESGTVVLVSPSTVRIRTFLSGNPGYDPIKAFAAIGQIGQGTMVLFAKRSYSNWLAIIPMPTTDTAQTPVRSQAIPAP